MNNIVNLEKKFINEDFKTNHLIKMGKSEYILSAPHSVSQVRKKKKKLGEFRTGVLVDILQSRLNIHSIYKCKNLGDDANYDLEHPYKLDLITHINKHNLKMVIDIHLCSPKRNFDICIGTGRGSNIQGRYDLLNILLDSLRSHYTKTIIDGPLPSLGQGTVCNNLSDSLGIPCFQLEFNWLIVETEEKCNILIDILEKIFTELSKHI